jgi:hypothetical protein
MSQCEWITPSGQCGSEQISGSKFCDEHTVGGTAIMINQYRVACKLLGDAPERHAQADEIKSLRGEIVLLRSLIEARLNLVTNEAELVAAMPILKDFFIATEKIVASCHSMETKLGQLLNKQAIMSLAQDMIQIIDVNLKSMKDLETTTLDLTIEQIGRELVETIAKQENQT